MAECEWLILCDYAFQAERGKLCVIGIFDRIFTAAVPTKHHQAALAFQLIGEPKETFTLKIDIVRPSGGTLLNLEAKVQLGENGALRAQIQLADLVLPDFGTYAFNVYADGVLVKTSPFVVQEVKPPTSSAAEG